MRSHHAITRLGLVSLLGAILTLAPAVRAAQETSADAGKLLAGARSQAVQLEKDALALQAYTTGKLGTLAKGHAALTERVNRDVSRAGSLSFAMQDARSAATPAQQAAIDRIDPLLKELAGTLNTTMMRVPMVSGVVQNPPYTEYLRANAQLASNLARMISMLVDYSDAKAKSQEIERQVELINFD